MPSGRSHSLIDALPASLLAQSAATPAPKPAPAKSKRSASPRKPPQTENRSSHAYNWRERVNLKRGR